MKRFNIGAMYRELEVECDQARTWAARWKAAAKDWKENAIISDNEAKRWWGKYRETVKERDEAIQEKHRAWASLDHAIEENRRVERERDGLRDELKASTELLRIREEQLAEELQRRAELERERDKAIEHVVRLVERCRQLERGQ